ncbi:hypothetical protein [Burkholderia stagnalis]|uniref:hypothetical protein n=1 Tax=Burkholderia stagnalis TaxID=1503054 RepID=UPI0012D97EB7|nr:hypothetical protein [Burkholderia stagnalis]
MKVKAAGGLWQGSRMNYHKLEQVRADATRDRTVPRGTIHANVVWTFTEGHVQHAVLDMP